MSTSDEILSDERRNKIGEAFNRVDRNRSGTIQVNQISSLLKNAKENYTDEEIEDALVQIGKTHSDEGTYDDIIDLICSVNNDQSILNAFAVFDKDQTGYITKDELRFLLNKYGTVITDKDIDVIFGASNLNNTNKIKYEDFVKFWSSQ